MMQVVRLPKQTTVRFDRLPKGKAGMFFNEHGKEFMPMRDYRSDGLGQAVRVDGLEAGDIVTFKKHGCVTPVNPIKQEPKLTRWDERPDTPFVFISDMSCAGSVFYCNGKGNIHADEVGFCLQDRTYLKMCPNDLIQILNVKIVEQEPSDDAE